MATIDEKAMNGADLKRFAALVKKTASQSAHGMMSKEDKAKLDGIEAQANKTVVDAALSSSSTNPVQNKVINTALGTKTNTTDLSSSASGKGSSMVAYDGNNTVKDALDDLYETIGGSGGESLSDRIDALEEGKEDKALVVTLTGVDQSWDDPSETKFFIDKTSEEILAADKVYVHVPNAIATAMGITEITLEEKARQTSDGYAAISFQHFFDRVTSVRGYLSVFDIGGAAFIVSTPDVYQVDMVAGNNVQITNGTDPTRGYAIQTISASDEKVNQTASTENADIPMLLASGATPGNGGTKYDADLKYNPSTNTLKLGTATLTATDYSGNAATATNATNDGSGNNIANTYALKTDVMNPHPTIVTTLPTADGTHHGFYFVKDTSSTRENVYTEYIEVQENSTWKWEPIGSTDVTLDVAYLTTTEVETIWNDTSWT